MVVDKQTRTEERLSMSLHVVQTSDFSTKPGNYFVLQYQLHLKDWHGPDKHIYPGLSLL